tara:strand:+ start:107 stop:373 length:267 start_codon:yes stop_codon:yes gene_type:complete
MDINQLTEIVKKKITKKINVESIIIEDKTFLHKDHRSFQKNKFHIKLKIKSDYFNNKSSIDSTKIIYKVLDDEIKKYIHSIQILFIKT